MKQIIKIKKTADLKVSDQMQKFKPEEIFFWAFLHTPSKLPLSQNRSCLA